MRKSHLAEIEGENRTVTSHLAEKLDPVLGVRPSLILEPNRARIREIARQHNIENVSIYGSVARGEDTPRSDIDVFIDFIPAARRRITELMAFEAEVERLLGVRVEAHLRPRRHLEHKPQYRRAQREEIAV